MKIPNSPAAWSARAASAATSWEACGWSQRSQPTRFAKIVELLDPQPDETLLDWGCGTGSLLDHLPGGLHYIGYDWADGMIQRARREHPGVFFFDRPYNLQPDLVAVIGTYNLPGSKQETWHTLRWLWDLGPRALAVSLYAGTDSRCLIYTEDEIHRELDWFSWNVTVIRWRDNDVIAAVRR